MLRIRLTRIGKKKQPSFRIVVAEHRRAVKGKFNEILGHYHPYLNPKQLKINQERVKFWLEKGAEPSKTVAALLRQKEILAPLSKEEFLKLQKKRPKREERRAKKEAEAESKDKKEKPAPAKAGVEKAPSKEGEKPESKKEDKPKEEKKPTPPVDKEESKAKDKKTEEPKKAAQSAVPSLPREAGGAREPDKKSEPKKEGKPREKKKEDKPKPEEKSKEEKKDK